MNNLPGFELDPEIMGVLPLESEEGSFENRPTRLIECPCGCGQPFAQFADGDEEEASTQTYALRAQAANVPLVVYMSALADALMETALGTLLESALGDLAELIAEETGAAGVLIGVGPEGLIIGTLSPVEGTETDDTPDWFNDLRNWDDDETLQ